jgi:hypothetical protein
MELQAGSEYLCFHRNKEEQIQESIRFRKDYPSEAEQSAGLEYNPWF